MIRYNYRRTIHGGILMSNTRVRGVIPKEEGLILIHRIKVENGIKREYYVFPGGGMEEDDNEQIYKTVVREVEEELGIIVSPEKKLYEIKNENGNEIFVLCNHISGEIGTGTGPEFTTLEYSDRGLYFPEILTFSQFENVDLLEPVKNAIIQDLKEYGDLKNAPFRYLNDM